MSVCTLPLTWRPSRGGMWGTAGLLGVAMPLLDSFAVFHVQDLGKAVSDLSRVGLAETDVALLSPRHQVNKLPRTATPPR